MSLPTRKRNDFGSTVSRLINFNTSMRILLAVTTYPVRVSFLSLA
ncbi:hypothetical protein HMPREF9435_1040 [Gardnerella vaginalis 315-A]|nr:hypothetical protein HMPREF9435_1040 [Gardnerella vaginalis 315-A]